MVDGEDREMATKESSVDCLGWREAVGVILWVVLVRRAEHQGIELKCARSGSSILGVEEMILRKELRIG